MINMHPSSQGRGNRHNEKKQQSQNLSIHTKRPILTKIIYYHVPRGEGQRPTCHATVNFDAKERHWVLTFSVIVLPC